MVNFSVLPSPFSIFSAYASVSASIMLFQTMLNQILPHQLQHYLFSRIHHFFKPLSSSTITLVIEERDGMSSNEIYDAAETYLYTKISPEIDLYKLSKIPKEKKLRVNFAKSWKTVDSFEGVEIIWRFVSEECKKSSYDDFENGISLVSEKRHFELCFENKYKDKVLDFYVPFVLKEANVINAEKKSVKLHTLACATSYSSAQFWDSINFEHPSTFATLAIDAGQKKAIIEDLDMFLRRKEFYKKVGKVWKRGYLLYGPPGTGKSSLIAAMANYLKFDIFDLDLANVKRDSDLKRLLLRTTNKSILVIEDIDCSIELPDRRRTTSLDLSNNADARPRDQQFTLAGLLNFIDGLWSSCGDERIIIFTTNNKDKLDPALLRPGRMDMHIHMSYLTIEGFKVLAKNYLKVNDQQKWLFTKVQQLIENVQVTPAEVAEQLMQSESTSVCLERLVKFLKRKRIKNEEKDDGSDVLELYKTKKMKTFDNVMNSLEVI